MYTANAAVTSEIIVYTPGHVLMDIHNSMYETFASGAGGVLCNIFRAILLGLGSSIWEGEGAQKLEVQDSVEENGSKENTGPRVESRSRAWNWILSDTLGLRS